MIFRKTATIFVLAAITITASQLAFGRGFGSLSYGGWIVTEVKVDTSGVSAWSKNDSLLMGATFQASPRGIESIVHGQKLSCERPSVNVQEPAVRLGALIERLYGPETDAGQEDSEMGRMGIVADPGELVRVYRVKCETGLINSSSNSFTVFQLKPDTVAIPWGAGALLILRRDRKSDGG